MTDSNESTAPANDTTAETPAVDSGEGVQPETSDRVERARQERERLEKENDRFEKNLKRFEELQANQLLGGATVGGQPAPKKETDKEYAQKVMRGEID